MSDMEARVSKLEQIAEETKLVLEKILVRLNGMDGRFTNIGKQIAALDIRVQVIDAKLDSKPDQGWIFTMLTAMIASALGIAGLTLAAVSILK